jgi:hypothetical protein
MAAHSSDRPRPDLIEKSADPNRPEPLSHTGDFIISQSMKLIKGDRQDTQDTMGGQRTVIQTDAYGLDKPLNEPGMNNYYRSLSDRTTLFRISISGGLKANEGTRCDAYRA